MNKESLYHIAQGIKEKLETIESFYDAVSGDGQITDDKVQAISNMESELGVLDHSFETKVESIAYYVIKLKHEIENCNSEIDRVNNIKRVKTNTMNRIKKYLIDSMMSVNELKVETDKIKVRVQKNNPAIEIIDQYHIPEDFIITKTTKTIDRKAILDMIKKEGMFPGAILKPESYHVRIT